MRSKLIAGCAGVVIASFVWQASADVTVVNDPFSDGGRTNGADPLDIPWFTRDSTKVTLSVVNDTVINNGNGLFLDSTGSPAGNVPVVGTFAPTPFYSFGDVIRLSFDFRLITLGTANSAGLRFGLYNSNGTTVTADNSALSDNDFGYLGLIGIQTAGAFINGETAATDQIGGGLGSFTPTSASPNLSVVNINDTTTKHSIALLVSNSSPTRVDLLLFVDNVLAASAFQTTTSLFTTFDEIMIRPNSGMDLTIDNVMVEYIPEPSATLLCILGLGVARVFTRRTERQPTRASH